MEKIAPACDHAEDLISFLYGEATEDEARIMRQHLSSCSLCAEELAAFRGVRESVLAWRTETLGAFSPTLAPTSAREAVRTRSAVAALREFFGLSPVWLKGAVAFASLLFCLLAALAISRFEGSTPTVTTERLYTQREVDQIIKAQQEAQPTLAVDTSEPKKHEVERDSPAPVQRKRLRRAGNAPATVAAKKRRPLTREEREQLAADLRLIAPEDDGDLDLLGDGVNRQDQ